MGRYYQTQEMEYIRDNVYTPPIDLMTKVIQNLDVQRAATDKAAQDELAKLKLDTMDIDNPKKIEIFNNYRKSIEENTKKLKEGNMNFGEIRANINQTASDINSNFTEGELFQMSKQKETLDKSIADGLERIKATTGRVLPEDVKKVTDYAIKKYNDQGGLQYKSPTEFNKFEINPFASFYSVNDNGEKMISGWKESGRKTEYDSLSGLYKITNGNSITYASSKELRKSLTNRMYNDPEYMNYENQQVLVSGGNPDDVRKKIREKNDEIINGLVAKADFQTTENTRKIEADNVALSQQARQSGVDNATAAGASLDVANAIGNLEQLNIEKKQLLTKIFDKVTIPGFNKDNIDEMSYEKATQILSNAKKGAKPAVYNILNGYQKQILNIIADQKVNIKASFLPFNASDDQIIAYQNTFNSNALTIPVTFQDFKIVDIQNNKEVTKKSKSGANKITPQTMIGQTTYSEIYGEHYRVIGVAPVKDGILPIKTSKTNMGDNSNYMNYSITVKKVTKNEEGGFNEPEGDPIKIVRNATSTMRESVELHTNN